MLRVIPILCLTMLMSPPAFSQTGATKKNINTQLYEQEPDREKDKSFTAKVRVVREISDEIEVFFESEEAKGAYSLPKGTHDYATALKNLEKSRAPHGPTVTVTADPDKRIKSIKIPKPTKGHDQKERNPSDFLDL